jgi:hypothetical protein
MVTMSGMNADRTRKIRKKMGRIKTTTIIAEEEMETIMGERERNNNAPKEMGEPLETVADPTAVEAQTRKKKFRPLVTAKEKKRKLRRNQYPVPKF